MSERIVSTTLTGRVPTSYAFAQLVEAATALRGVLTIAAGVVSTLKVDKELMLKRVGAFWAQASDLAAAMVMEKGLPWRVAHQIVGILVRQAEEEGKGPRDVTPERLDRAAVAYLGKPVGMSAESIARALDPVACIGMRRITGG